jgi:hypothetical protein
MRVNTRWSVVLMLVFMGADLPAQRRNVGLVVAVDGPWLADGQPVKRGQSLLSGARISAPSANFALPTAYRISVRLLNDQPWSRTCNSVSACSETVLLPTALGEAAPFLSRLADAFTRLVRDPEERYAVAKSRSGETTKGLPDAVVRVESGQVFVGPLFDDLPRGRYVLEFWRPGTASSTGLTVSFDWTRMLQGAQWPDNAPPGVYEVTLYRESAKDVPIGSPAWWLVEPPARYPQSKAAFDEAVAATASWRRDVDQDSVTDVLHAYLDSLAAR